MSDDLLKHYEKELAFLHKAMAEFGQRHPKIGSRLRISGERPEDPFVDRLLDGVPEKKRHSVELAAEAIRNAARLVWRNSPSSASFGANATECRSRWSLPNWSPMVLKTPAISSSFVTSHGNMSVSAPNVVTSSVTLSLTRSP